MRVVARLITDCGCGAGYGPPVAMRRIAAGHAYVVVEKYKLVHGLAEERMLTGVNAIAVVMAAVVGVARDLAARQSCQLTTAQEDEVLMMGRPVHLANWWAVVVGEDVKAIFV